MGMETAASSIITVVIPAYNRAGVVSRTLSCIEAQTTRRFSLILVDNNSTDATMAVMQRWADSHRDIPTMVLSEHRRGAAAARNRGLAAVTTPWVMFFDSDDTMQPQHIQRVIDAIDSLGEDYDIMGWDLRYHYPGGTDRLYKFYTRDVQYNCLMHGSMSSQRYCARTELIRRVGCWAEEVGVWDDIELGARLLQATSRIYKIKGTPTADVYVGADSLTIGESPDNISRIDDALVRMEQTLGADRAHWIQLKRMILAGVGARKHSPAAYRLRDDVLRHTPRAYHRCLLRIAFRYTSCGGRGIARLLRPLM